MQQKLHLTRK